MKHHALGSVSSLCSHWLPLGFSQEPPVVEGRVSAKACLEPVAGGQRWGRGAAAPAAPAKPTPRKADGKPVLGTTARVRMLSGCRLAVAESDL